MVYNSKVELLVSELFRGWEGGRKRLLLVLAQLHKMKRGCKTDLLVEKRKPVWTWLHNFSAER